MLTGMFLGLCSAVIDYTDMWDETTMEVILEDKVGKTYIKGEGLGNSIPFGSANQTF